MSAATLITLTGDNFDAILSEHELVIIDFWAEWCGPCKSFLPVYEQIAANNPDVAFTKVDIDSEKALAADFQVRSIPQIVVMKQNVVVFSESGLMQASALQNLVDQARNLDLSDVHKQIKDAEDDS